MVKNRRFTGDYAENGKQARLRVREEAGHRCIRCEHPFECGKHGKGEWSRCDEKCTHGGPARYFDGLLGWSPWLLGCTTGERVCIGARIQAQWRILTVHHLDGDKSNDAWWNTLALCQRCHLEIQGKVDPRIPWMLEHSLWFRPYVAGYYAKKYLGIDLTRAQAESRMDELLALERRA